MTAHHIPLFPVVCDSTAACESGCGRQSRRCHLTSSLIHHIAGAARRETDAVRSVPVAAPPRQHRLIESNLNLISRPPGDVFPGWQSCQHRRASRVPAAERVLPRARLRFPPANILSLLPLGTTGAGTSTAAESVLRVRKRECGCAPPFLISAPRVSTSVPSTLVQQQQQQ